MSIKYKITLLFVSMVVMILLILSLGVYYFSASSRKAAFEERLKNRALSSANVYAGIRGGDSATLQRMNESMVASLTDRSIAVYRQGRGYEYVFSDRPGDSVALGSKILDRVAEKGELSFTDRGRPAFAVYHRAAGGDFVFAVAAVDLEGREYLAQLKRILFLAGLLGICLSFIAGLIFARRIVRPINRISEEVNAISSSSLSQRIQTVGTRDELSRLSDTFNQLLDRLEESFSIQRRFISNASHELSNPLTSISSQLDVALQRYRTTEEYRDVLLSVREDILSLQQLTRSLLDIAKAGTQGSIDLENVRLDELLFGVIEDIHRQNPEYKIRFSAEDYPEEEEKLTVFGNANLLYIAFKNIIDNGCKYSENMSASVDIRFGPKKIEVAVVNKGDVIAESDIRNIFQPFFRTASAQQKSGFGLGLTLTRRILSLHKGSIYVESDPHSGTRFTVTLPNRV